MNTERTYFTINESSARMAHNMMSFTEYAEGSATMDYRRDADRAYNLADLVAETAPEEAERAYRLAVRYAKKMAEYYNREASIGMICPSVMISGGSNFPAKKKERQVAAWEKNHRFYEEVQKILGKIESILNGKGIIKSDDAKAVEKLEENLKDMITLQEQMKAANRALRLKDVEAGNDALREMGYSEESIRKLREPDFCGRIGYPDYALSNNNANIHRVERRIKGLIAVKEKGGSEQEYKTFRVVENTEAMRYQIIFDEKPEAEIRALLKSYGFKWAPSQGAWQRHITENGLIAVKYVVKALQKLQ